MKNIVFLFGLIFLVVFSSSCQNDNIETLTQEEIDDLTYLREEEKLARDVYLYAYDKYEEQIFNNISQSEQKHMDKVLSLLNKYDLPDSAQAQRGHFKNTTLQGLYNDLTNLVDLSLIDALKVGATIEDLDINDIDKNESRTDKSDLLDVYQKLNCGSRNHMRAFSRALSNNNITYTLQFISLDAYNAIINSNNEQCGKQ